MLSLHNSESAQASTPVRQQHRRCIKPAASDQPVCALVKGNRSHPPCSAAQDAHLSTHSCEFKCMQQTEHAGSIGSMWAEDCQASRTCWAVSRLGSCIYRQIDSCWQALIPQLEMAWLVMLMICVAPIQGGSHVKADLPIWLRILLWLIARCWL